jgi:hypothetical protein
MTTSLMVLLIGVRISSKMHHLFIKNDIRSLLNIKILQKKKNNKIKKKKKKRRWGQIFVNIYK